MANNPTDFKMTYNRIGQTDSIALPNSSAVPMAYDGVTSDRRTQAGNTSMSYGFSGLTAQRTPGTNGGSTRNEIFVRDPDGTLIAMLKKNDNNTPNDTSDDTISSAVRYYLLDDQGTVQATTDETGHDVTRYLYDPYGKKLRTWVDQAAGDTSRSPNTTTNPNNLSDGSTNANYTAPAVDNNPFGYVSGYESQGLIKFGTRYYNPNVANWTQPDPKAQGPEEAVKQNEYQYTQGNPVNRIDTSGRDDCQTGIVSGIFSGVGLAASTYSLVFAPPTGGLSLAVTVIGYEASIGGAIFSIDTIIESC